MPDEDWETSEAAAVSRFAHQRRVEAWLRVPQQMMPGTLMPAYFHSFDPDADETLL